MPTHIVLIRHAEKPLGTVAPYGVDEEGRIDAESLTPRGWQRAGALVRFLVSPDGGPGSSGLPIPTHLCASQVGPGSSSRRPMQTLAPLAARLGLAIDVRFRKQELDGLAVAISAIDGVVVISWEHHLLPSLANSLLSGAPMVPQVWPDDRFDIAWVLEPAGAAPRFMQVPQELLAGDSGQVIS
jgi:hypothetical protein